MQGRLAYSSGAITGLYKCKFGTVYQQLTGFQLTTCVKWSLGNSWSILVVYFFFRPTQPLILSSNQVTRRRSRVAVV